MKILSVTGHGCIRATKMNLCLMDKGHDVHFATKRIVPYCINYKTHGIGQDIRQMKELFKLYEPVVDLCHAHNEPSWYVTLWKEISHKPVILDVHDSCLARITPEEWVKQNETTGKHNVRISCEERNNFQLADGLVFPSENFKNLVSGEFGLSQPSVVLPSYVPAGFYSYFPLEWYGGLVYEGKVALDKELPMFTYCDYREAAKQACELGLDFHLYPAGYPEKIQPLYDKPECKTTYIHQPKIMDDLLKNLGRHDWGLVGNVTPTAEWDVSLPNKLFEYIGAGLPVAVINAKEAGEFVLAHGVGIVVKSLAELTERWAEHREIRQVLVKKRFQFSMDANIETLEKLYGDLLCN